MDIEDRVLATLTGALVLAMCILVLGSVGTVLIAMGPWAVVAVGLTALYLSVSYHIGKAMMDL